MDYCFTRRRNIPKADYLWQIDNWFSNFAFSSTFDPTVWSSNKETTGDNISTHRGITTKLSKVPDHCHHIGWICGGKNRLSKVCGDVAKVSWTPAWPLRFPCALVYSGLSPVVIINMVKELTPGAGGEQPNRQLLLFAKTGLPKTVRYENIVYCFWVCVFYLQTKPTRAVQRLFKFLLDKYRF